MSNLVLALQVVLAAKSSFHVIFKEAWPRLDLMRTRSLSLPSGFTSSFL
jgi:hypothetical protein